MILKDESQHLFIRRMRMTVALLFALGAVSGSLGYLPQGLIVTDRHYAQHFEAAGGRWLALYVAVLLLPGPGVAWRPTWLAILGWIVWAVSLTAVASYLLLRPDSLYSQNEMLGPLWPAWIAYSMIAAMLLGIIIVIPTMRIGYRSPQPPES